MFNIGPGELIIVALVLLIAVGPEQLPGVIRRVGRAASQLRDMTDSLRSEFMSGMEEIERAADPNSWAGSAGPSQVSPAKKPTNPTARTTSPTPAGDVEEAADASDGEPTSEVEPSGDGVSPDAEPAEEAGSSEVEPSGDGVSPDAEPAEEDGLSETEPSPADSVRSGNGEPSSNGSESALPTPLEDDELSTDDDGGQHSVEESA